MAVGGVGGGGEIKIWWARESTGWDFSWRGWNEQIFGSSPSRKTMYSVCIQNFSEK